MLSNTKWTFSLMSLVVLILAFGLAYVVSPVMAHDVVRRVGVDR